VEVHNHPREELCLEGCPVYRSDMQFECSAQASINGHEVECDQLFGHDTNHHSMVDDQSVEWWYLPAPVGWRLLL
jgi:hypothetical protein